MQLATCICSSPDNGCGWRSSTEMPSHASLSFELLLWSKPVQHTNEAAALGAVALLEALLLLGLSKGQHQVHHTAGRNLQSRNAVTTPGMMLLRLASTTPQC